MTPYNKIDLLVCISNEYTQYIYRYRSRHHMSNVMSVNQTPQTIASSVQDNTVSRSPRILSIEGNIGSGKSTLLEELKLHYMGNPNIVFLDEPVEVWNTIRDDNGVTMLEKFYGNQVKYSFSFQMMAYISRLAIIKEAIRENPNRVFISERCLHTDKYVFAKMLYDSGKIEQVDYQIYNMWFNTFMDDFTVDHIVYIKADPTVCSERVKTRARDGETIPLEYLTECDHYHTRMMQMVGIDHTFINGNENIYNDPGHLRNWMFTVGETVDRMLRELTPPGTPMCLDASSSGETPDDTSVFDIDTLTL